MTRAEMIAALKQLADATHWESNDDVAGPAGSETPDAPGGTR